MHEFYDPEGTGRCQARPVYLAIPGAIEAKCLMTPQQHERRNRLWPKIRALVEADPL